MSEEKAIVVYHYHRGKDIFTTPNVEIAIARRGDIKKIHVETVKDGESEWSVLALD